MKYLLGLLAGFVIADGVLTHFLVGNGLAREINPFLVNMVGDSTFLVLKVLGALLCVFILWDIHRRLPRLALIATTCFAGVYAIIVIWNTSIFFIV